MDVWAYGCWEEICNPNMLSAFEIQNSVMIFVFVSHLLVGVKPVWWWASLCRNRCCPMNALVGSEAEGRRSLKQWPQWELDPRRGIRGRQTPVNRAS